MDELVLVVKAARALTEGPMTGDAGMLPVVALDVGGSHVTAAQVDVHARRVMAGTRRDRVLRPDGAASEILGGIIACAAEAMRATAGDSPEPARRVGRSEVATTMGVAMPGPFDYDTGIGRFTGVAKFESLDGVDVGAALRAAVPVITQVRFLNDADAFGLGEWTAGAASGHDRAVAITIGTGIGSAFLDRGRFVGSGPTVPPAGRAYRLTIDGVDLEERVSRRAIMRDAAGHPALASRPGADVRELAEAARTGDRAAAAIFEDVLDALGRALGEWLARFGATILVVGGAIGGSWDLVEPPLTVGLARSALPWRGPVERPQLGPDAGLIGAAMATRQAPVPRAAPQDASTDLHDDIVGGTIDARPPSTPHP